MVTLDSLRKVFAKKLVTDNDMDAALGKVVWLAYNEGLKDGLSDTRTDEAKLLVSVESILQKGYE